MTTLDPGLVAMCPDVNADAVKCTGLETDLTDSQINFWLNTAYYMTQPLSGELTACGGNSMHCNIITVLAAHFIATAPEGSVKSQSVAGEWSVTFRGQDGMGLEASMYGQQALAMDCSGILATLGLKKASFAVTDYEAIEGL
jgi:hypothetical protein